MSSSYRELQLFPASHLFPCPPSATPWPCRSPTLTPLTRSTTHDAQTSSTGSSAPGTGKSSSSETWASCSLLISSTPLVYPKCSWCSNLGVYTKMCVWNSRALSRNPEIFAWSLSEISDSQSLVGPSRRMYHSTGPAMGLEVSVPWPDVTNSLFQVTGACPGL